MFFLEGLKPEIEELPEGAEAKDRIFPFDEVRIIVSGELILDVVGNKVLLREGDRVMIPSNTKHSVSAHKGASTSLYARKVFTS
jgi:quercetin dioxygenase-like cupin family protein